MTATKRIDWPLAIWLGLTLTAAWIVGVSYVCYRQWDNVVGAHPNIIGDFAAGATAPIAFLWLVVAVFLQMQELREQRNEFRALREESEKQTVLREREADAQRWSLLAEGIDAEIEFLARDIVPTLADMRFVYTTRNGNRQACLLLHDPEHIRELVKQNEFTGAILEAIGQLTTADSISSGFRDDIVQNLTNPTTVQYLAERVDRIIRRSVIPHPRLATRIGSMRLSELRDSLLRLSKLPLVE